MNIPHAWFGFCELKPSARSFEIQTGASLDAFEVCDLETGNESNVPSAASWTAQHCLYSS